MRYHTMQAESPQDAYHSEGGSVESTPKDAGGWCDMPFQQRTKTDTFPLPRIDDLLGQLGSGRYFSTLNP